MAAGSRLLIGRDLIRALRDKGRIVDDQYEGAVQHNLGRAQAIREYKFPTVEFAKPHHRRTRRSGTRTSPKSSCVSTTRGRDLDKLTSF